jgi:predicted dehydrogenase
MHNKKVVRWAILGPGKIARKFAEDLRATSKTQLVAVASRDTLRAQNFASEYGIKKVLTYDELYTSSEVDAVYVATPHSFHYEQSLACLQNGKAVLVEKPATINLKQFQHLVTVAHENKAFLMEAMWSYFMPALHKAKEWIVQGRIGSIKMITADFGYCMEFNPNNRIYNPWLAGGALLDLGIYPIAFSSFIMDRKPDHIVATARIGQTGIDESTVMVLTYDDITSVLNTTVLANTLNKGYIFGTEGYIELPDFYKASTCFLYGKDKELIDTFNDNRPTFGYHYEIQEATDCILNGTLESSVVSHHNTILLQEIMKEVRIQIGLRYPMET